MERTKLIKAVSLLALGLFMLAILLAAPSESEAKPPSSDAGTTPAPAGTPAKMPTERKFLPPRAGGSTCNALFGSGRFDDTPKRDCRATDSCCVETFDRGGQSSYCVDLKTDPAHCGGCGRTCQQGEACVDGLCGCPKGQIRCGAKCVDAAEDYENCGACGKKCSKVCSKGKCTTCAAIGQGSDCGDDTTGHYCANLNSDDLNCGKCAHSCQGWTCMKGRCRP